MDLSTGNSKQASFADLRIVCGIYVWAFLPSGGIIILWALGWIPRVPIQGCLRNIYL